MRGRSPASPSAGRHVPRSPKRLRAQVSNSTSLSNSQGRLDGPRVDAREVFSAASCVISQQPHFQRMVLPWENGAGARRSRARPRGYGPSNGGSGDQGSGPGTDAPLAVRGWSLAPAALSGSPGLYRHTHATHTHACTCTHTHTVTGTRTAGRTRRNVNLAASGK